MELVQALLKKILFLIPAIIILALFFILARFLFSYFNIPTRLTQATAEKGTKKQDILPPPGSLSIGTGKAKTPTDEPTNPTMEEMNTEVYVDPTYASTTQGTTGTTKTESYPYNTTLYFATNPYVRNVKIIKNTSISSGTILTGEAHTDFMKSGKFLASITNAKGDVIASAVATAQGNPNKDAFAPWAVRFGNIPTGNKSCTLVFENENYSGDASLDKIVKIPTLCK